MIFENSISIVFFRSNCTLISSNKHRLFCFYCIVSITMARWFYWVNSEHFASTALLQSQCQVDITDETPSILFLWHCYDHIATMISLSKQWAFFLLFCFGHNAKYILLSKPRAISFYCIVTITMARCSLCCTPSSLFLQHSNHQNWAMTSLSKLRAFCFYCIVTSTMAR
jgi:hypothetical protein